MIDEKDIDRKKIEELIIIYVGACDEPVPSDLHLQIGFFFVIKSSPRNRGIT